MKRIISYIYAVVAAVALLSVGGCDQTNVTVTEQRAPLIESFTPESAPVGAEIIITGKNLDGVTKAFIGDKVMVIKEKVSDTRLSIIAGAEGRGGKITLENPVGRGESEKSYTYSYAIPEVKTLLLQSSVDMGDRMLLPGSNLSAVAAVLFTANGFTTENEGQIMERSATELVVRVPYVESDNARITLRYFDGSSSVTTPLEGAPTIAVKRYKPAFDAVVLGRTAVGKTVTLTGTYLDKVDRILVNGFEAVASKQPTTLTFTVPAGDFVEGETVTSLVVEYFEGHESYTISNNFNVFVPFVKFWENINTWCQSRKAEQLAGFFSPETGVVYENAKWRTVVDPLSSSKFPVPVCSANNTPSVTAAEYATVNPYFYFSVTSSAFPQVNSPANTNGQLKNFYINAVNPSGTTTDSNRVPGANNTQYGTPALSYRYLSEANADEKAIIDAVRNQTIEKLDESNFPIDLAAETVAKVAMTSAKGTLDSQVWGAGLFNKKDALHVKVDAVILVLYHDAQGGFKTGSTTAVRVDNVKRIGLLHICEVDYINEAEASGKYGTCSRVNFNCYWQKYDYDYSKVVK